MRWGLNNPNAFEVIAAYEKFKQDIPEELIAPVLHDVEISIWNVFLEMSSGRQSGSPICGLLIRKYAEVMGIDSSTFHQVIKLMDDAYLAHKSGDGKTFTREMMKR